MDRTNLLITGGIIGAIIVLLSIGMFMFPNSTSNDNYESDNLMNLYGLNSADEGSNTYTVAGDDFSFDNSTPEKTAISIARLNEGQMGFDSYITADASLTPDGKCWIVKMHDGEDTWVVTIDAKTLMSKRDKSKYKPATVWRSLDELKAAYIAELQIFEGAYIEKPCKTALKGKIVWKVPVYDAFKNKITEYIYVDLATGKSKVFDLETGPKEWLTLKEVDDTFNNMYDAKPDPLFSDALRNLYPE